MNLYQWKKNLQTSQLTSGKTGDGLKSNLFGSGWIWVVGMLEDPLNKDSRHFWWHGLPFSRTRLRHFGLFGV